MQRRQDLLLGLLQLQSSPSCSSTGASPAELWRTSVACRLQPPLCFFSSNGDPLEPCRIRSFLTTRRRQKGGNQVLVELLLSFLPVWWRWRNEATALSGSSPATMALVSGWYCVKGSDLRFCCLFWGPLSKMQRLACIFLFFVGPCVTCALMLIEGPVRISRT